MYPREAGTFSRTPGTGLYVLMKCLKVWQLKAYSVDQHRPELVLIISDRRRGSSPNLNRTIRQYIVKTTYLTPRFKASATPIIWMPSSMLLQIFVACPAPTFPQWIAFLPIKSKNCFERWNPFSHPPTINVRVPFSAPTTPPETGASRNIACFSDTFSASSMLTGGSIVLQSTHIELGFKVLKMGYTHT